MNYKEIKQHNRRESKKFYDTWLTDNPYKANYIDLYQFICEQATSDEGMTKNHKSMFHSSNPNGLVAQLPNTDDFAYIDNPKIWNGFYTVYSKWSNYHADMIRKYSHKRSGFTAWDVNYHIKALKEDVAKAKEHMIKHKLVGSLAA